MRTLYFLVLVQVQQRYDIFVFFCIHLCYPANVVQMLQGKMKWDFHAVKGKACISYWELNLNSGSVGTVTK